MNDLLNECNSVFQYAALDWKDAVRQAGKLLIARGSAKEAYVDAMIRSVEELGPYMVIAPGIALAHARPDESVLKNDLVLTTLATPVKFGNPDNDPVRLVFAFCAKDSNEHLEQLRVLAEALSDDKWVEKLKHARNIRETA